jgi:tRNA threonylcarbamoyladenosine biosynthesis protein TsaE
MTTSKADVLEAASAAPEETQVLGAQLGGLLKAGDVVLLQGELGAGKTCFAQGIAHGLGVTDYVVSPTFVLVNQYRGRERLYHADLYRLEAPGEVADLQLSLSSEDGVLVVEWPERDRESLPNEHLLVRLEDAGESGRRLTFIAHGARPSMLVRELKTVLATPASIQRGMG